MQTHLKGFGLENFRVFKDYTWFDFAPITILTGPNSSGKSSLNKALMLMKNNFEKGNLPPHYYMVGEGFSSSEHSEFFQKSRLMPDFEKEMFQTFEPNAIEFNSKIHGLNDPSTTISRFTNHNNLSFTIPYDIKVYQEDVEEKSSTPFESSSNKKGNVEPKSIEFDHTEGKLIYAGISLDELFYYANYKSVKYHLTFIVDNKKARTCSKIEIRNFKNQCILKITDHEVYFNVSIFNNLFESDHFKINHLLDNSKKSIHSSSGASFLTWLTENGVEIDHAKELNTKIFSQLGLTNESGKIAVKAVEQHISGADYLSTIRNEQKRIYSDEDKSAFKSILESLDNARNNGFDFDNYLSECSKLFDVDGIFDFDYDSEKGIYFPSINGQSFVNVGFGLGQIALIIFKIAEHASKKYIRTNHGEYFFSNASSILILEEPESNLHPKFQSLLADLFVKAAETFNIQFIIETHSEYLIRKLQYLTAKKQVKPDDSVIYYFHDPREKREPDEKQVKKIEILEDGSLSDDFGPGFFDEAANWELELIRLKNSKNRNN